GAHARAGGAVRGGFGPRRGGALAVAGASLSARPGGSGLGRRPTRSHAGASGDGVPRRRRRSRDGTSGARVRVGARQGGPRTSLGPPLRGRLRRRSTGGRGGGSPIPRGPRGGGADREREDASRSRRRRRLPRLRRRGRLGPARSRAPSRPGRSRG